ncbi:MAG: hypothetical protein JWQ98_3492 [Chlorobi bacterium]|nr:hypothetical protein [Chlorobiota bacterium]
MNEALDLDDEDDLNGDDPDALPDYTRTKWIILISLVVVSAATPILEYMVPSRGTRYGMRAMGKMLIVFLAMIGAYNIVRIWIIGQHHL